MNRIPIHTLTITVIIMIAAVNLSPWWAVPIALVGGINLGYDLRKWMESR